MVHTAPQLFCPRCGYDVSGVVPTWKEQCPLEGTCSECGLVFVWVKIFRPERLHPAWSFEHVKTKRVRAWFKTVFIATGPRKLWGEMSMAAPIRAWRLGLMVVVLVLLSHLASGALEWWKEYAAGFRFGWPSTRIAPAVFWTQFGKTMAWPYGGGFYLQLIGPLTRLLLMWGALIPLPYLVLVDTMKMAKSRPAHLVRAWAYFVPVLSAVLLVGETFPHIPWLIPSTRWPVGVYRAWNVTSGLLAALAVFWYVRWWWQFTSVYLRLPQARLVVTLLLIVSLLTTLAFGLFLDRQQVDLIGSAINFFLG